MHCCHCRWCQRESGTSFALNALIETSCVRVLCGDPVSVTTPSNSGKGPWVTLPPGVPAVPEYYDRKQFWPPESLDRRRLLMA